MLALAPVIALLAVIPFGETIVPEALCAAYNAEGIMIRQGTYHTPKFGHRFVKVSTTVPEAWADAFCDRLPTMVERARGMRDLPTLF